MSNQNNTIYFIGIGGIGMSAIARYFLSKGYSVGGYDLTPSKLTEELEKEGAQIHYTDDIALVPSIFLSKDTLIVYTPAIPKTHTEFTFFQSNDYQLMKRSQILGQITKIERGLCVAGTHGKTTTSTLLAHLLKQSHVDCNAFLGGISNNYHTNLLLSDSSDLVVIEADEFDRSFHQLTPYMSVITSADPDHLDIYKTPEAYRESFEHFTSLHSNGGVLLIKSGIPLCPKVKDGVMVYSYDSDAKADFYADNIKIVDARLFFDWHYPAINGMESGSITVELGVPLRINVDNAVAAMAIAYLNSVTLEELQTGLASFRGVQRRFDRSIIGSHILIDDYAHHPVELSASINSVKTLYPNKKILGIFQPHLYSRTQDFYKEFAESLSVLDSIILLDIYPARELPIEGVTSNLIAKEIKDTEVILLSKDELIPFISKRQGLEDVILMVGAGDIDRLVTPVANLLQTL